MLNNRQLADTFTLIANLLEIKGEIIYKTLAYRKASESLMSLGREASEYWKEGKLEDIPGVGKAIAEKAKSAGIEQVAFDRSGFRYHGRVKALADAAREQGLRI